METKFLKLSSNCGIYYLYCIPNSRFKRIVPFLFFIFSLLQVQAQAPTISVSPSAPSICAGTSTNLTASGAGTGGTYSWSPSTGLNASTGATVTATPTTTTTYTVTGRTSAGVSNTKTVTVTVISVPAVVLPSSMSLCRDSYTEYTVPNNNTYSWTPASSGELVSSTIPGTVKFRFSPKSSGTHTLSSSRNGCTTVSSCVVAIKEKPMLSVNASYSLLCQAQQVTLTASGANSYLWFYTGGPNTGVAGPTLTNYQTTTTTYQVRGTNNSGCTGVLTTKIDGAFATIPDVQYRNYLKQTYPTCFQGDLLNVCCAKASSVAKQEATGLNIQSLEGLQYFEKLNEINFGDNKITFVPQLPANLKTVQLGSNLLTSIPSPLPSTLQFLGVGYNKLTSLPTLPLTLTGLQCQMNYLTNLPSLPTGLTILMCGFNGISTLPALPSTLKQLYCQDNILTSITIPSSVITVWCFKNCLTGSIPFVNPTMPENMQPSSPKNEAQKTSCVVTAHREGEEETVVTQTEEKSSLVVHPNPATSILNVNMEGVKVIYSQLGAELIRTEEKTINIERLQPGIYTLLIQQEGHGIKSTFVKQ